MGENPGEVAGISWAGVAWELLEFAQADPWTFALTVLLPLLAVGGFVVWFVKVLGVRRIRDLSKAFAEWLVKPPGDGDDGDKDQ